MVVERSLALLGMARLYVAQSGSSGDGAIRIRSLLLAAELWQRPSLPAQASDAISPI
jgi:hypothetical protein